MSFSSDRMPSRYLVAVVDGGGNVPPELHIVRRLVERGHHVVVLAEDSIAQEVAATGATMQRWEKAPNRPNRRPEHDVARDWECPYPWQIADRMLSTLMIGPAPRYADEVMAAIETTRPHLVICSMFCVGAMVAAEAARRPFDVPMANVYPLPAEGMPPFGVGLAPGTGVVGRARDRLINAVSERLWDKGLPALNTLRAHYGLPSLSRFLDQARRARRHLLMTSPAFDFPGTLPANVRYVGPVLDDPVWADAAEWSPPAGSGPLVLVALSSTFQDQRGCLQRVVDALSTLPVRGLVTTGPAIDPASLTSAPNVSIVERAPHRRVLEHAALLVTHGGHGTAMKGLAAGVPLLVLPHGRDQGDTAIRVTSRGAGLALKNTASSNTIAGAMKRILGDEAYRTSARAIGDAIRRDAQSDVLIRELEQIGTPEPATA